MANGRILMAQEEASLLQMAVATLGAVATAPEVVPCPDGASFVSQFTRLSRAGQAPRLSVLDTRIAGLSGAAAALSTRAIERGLALPPVPILFYTAEPASDELKQLLGRIGRAVHLPRPADLPLEEQCRRLCVAIEKLLAQLGSAA